MIPTSRIYIAGHRGLVGSALVRRLLTKGYKNLLTRSHAEADLEDQSAVGDLFAAEMPEYVFLAAAKVGGIHANNTYPVDFLLRNLKIQTNVIEAAHRCGVKGLLFLGSSCIYPKTAPQPIREEDLLTGLLEPTNEPYAIAKIAGIELCESFNRQYGTRFLSVMPTNLYGPNDNYDLESSHVLPALIRKFHLGKLAARGDWAAIFEDEKKRGTIPADICSNLAAIAGSHGHDLPVEVRNRCPIGAFGPTIRLWGTGSPKREFLYSDDLADACVFLMEHLEDIFSGIVNFPSPSLNSYGNSAPGAGNASTATGHLINIGYGCDVTIGELASLAAGIVGFDGPIEWDTSKPDGTPRKLLGSGKLNRLGWKPSINLENGIRLAYDDYLSHEESKPTEKKAL